MTQEAPILLWEDEAILVVNKPAGLLTIQDGYQPNLPHLAGLLTATYGRIWTVHRLDKDTSGVILFARSAAAHRALNAQFEARQVHKVYHALVQGTPEWDSQTTNAPLRVNADRRHRTRVDLAFGKAASTSLRVLERFRDGCLVEARPFSGYTHQVRAHLAALGLPLIGDLLYGAQETEIIWRPALHALRITFQHPDSGAEIVFEAPYPQDFTRAFAELA